MIAGKIGAPSRDSTWSRDVELLLIPSPLGMDSSMWHALPSQALVPGPGVPFLNCCLSPATHDHCLPLTCLAKTLIPVSGPSVSKRNKKKEVRENFPTVTLSPGIFLHSFSTLQWGCGIISEGCLAIRGQDEYLQVWYAVTKQWGEKKRHKSKKLEGSLQRVKPWHRCLILLRWKDQNYRRQRRTHQLTFRVIKYIYNLVMFKLFKWHTYREEPLFICMYALLIYTPQCIPVHKEIKPLMVRVCETSSLKSKLPNYASTSH